MSEVEPHPPAHKVEVHRIRKMSGRDPDEMHRVTTPLELLFDLTFVIGFGIAFAHQLAEDHVGAGLASFVFATFSICWAWINFSWFASAYDTDDWVYRLTTMLQMVGVIILSLGLPAMYASIAEGEHVDNRVMVAGYVVMRIALVTQWLRAAKQDPRALGMPDVRHRRHRRADRLDRHDRDQHVGRGDVRMGGRAGGLRDVRAMAGRATHGRHSLARSSHRRTLFAAHHHRPGRGCRRHRRLAVGCRLGAGLDCAAVLVAVAGTGLTFGMWWVYFIVPQSQLLHARRELSFRFGYLHLVVFGAIVGTGAGLHAAAYYVEHHSKLDAVGTVLSVAIPVAIYVVAVYLLYMLLTKSRDAFHLLLVVLTAGVLIAAVSSSRGACRWPTRC